MSLTDFFVINEIIFFTNEINLFTNETNFFTNEIYFVTHEINIFANEKYFVISEFCLPFLKYIFSCMEKLLSTMKSLFSRMKLIWQYINYKNIIITYVTSNAWFIYCVIAITVKIASIIILNKVDLGIQYWWKMISSLYDNTRNEIFSCMCIFFLSILTSKFEKCWIYFSKKKNRREKYFLNLRK